MSEPIERKKLVISYQQWENANAWSFDVDGLCLFRRPDDAKARWHVLHLPSGLSVTDGTTIAKAIARWRTIPGAEEIDWTLDAARVIEEINARC